MKRVPQLKGERSMREADDFPVLAGECGVRSGDYAN
jgi:hypothetical protein